MIDNGYSRDELIFISNAYKLAEKLFAGRFQSSGKDFIAHVVGTGSILAYLKLPVQLIAAGLIHNVYRSGDFGLRHAGVSNSKREYIKNALGEEVEAYVNRLNAIHWNTSTIHDIRERFEDLDPIERNTVLLKLADVLEHHLDLEVNYNENFEKQRWIDFIEQNGQTFIEIAQKLGYPSLASHLNKVFEETRSSKISLEPFCKRQESYSFVISPKSYRKKLSIALYEKLAAKVISFRYQILSVAKRARRRLSHFLHTFHLE